MRIILICLLWMNSNILCTQDIISLIAGKDVEAKVIEISSEQVKYRLFEFPDGPIYVEEKSNIAKIEYSNGRVEWISEEAKEGIQKTDEEQDITTPEIEDINDSKDLLQNENFEESPDFMNAAEEELTKESAFRIGVFLGANGATGLYNYKNGPNPPVLSVLPAYSVGAMFNMKLSPGFSLESSLAYRLKGDRINMFKWIDKIEPPTTSGPWIILDTEGDGTIKTEIGYIEWSVTPVFELSSSARIGLGGYFASGIHGKEKSDYTISSYFEGELASRDEIKSTRDIEFVDILGTDDTDAVRYINRFDYGFTTFIGFGTMPWTVRLTASYGRQTWEPDNDLFGSGETPRETYHLTGMLSVHYWIKY
ncbi:MAG: outer membrane beta-barrel protein [Bacteroidia bacterium]|nr:outer membrane beta-barrel protein [Bacteroidia bacterium]